MKIEVLAMPIRSPEQLRNRADDKRINAQDVAPHTHARLQLYVKRLVREPMKIGG